MIAPSYQTRLLVALAVVLTIVGAARVVATYRVFSNTMDEPYHIAAGLEWLQGGTNRFAGEHPPLGRIAAAVGPYAKGLRVDESGSYGTVALRVLFQHGAYVQNLFYARFGMLVFFLVTVAGVLTWTWQLYGAGAAVVAVLLVTTTPMVLAHSGLTTTDIPLAGTFIWAVIALAAFVDRPGMACGARVGVAAGFALVSKMSALLFLPTAGLTLATTRWLFTRVRGPRRTDVGTTGEASAKPRRRLRVELALVVATLVAFFIVWAAYRFSVGRRLWSFVPGGVPLPAPAFFDAIAALLVHNAVGHPGYLLGEFRTTGWWYFFPFAFLVKTPIPLLLLAGFGAVASIRHAWATRAWHLAAPIALVTTLVVVSLPISINIGLRHLLPVFPLLAMTGACGVMWLWNRQSGRLGARSVAAALVVWQAVSSARAHPDYLAYFNELAGSHPERLLLDSDLDWGQDLLRLADTVRVRQIPAIRVAYFGSADPARLLPAETRALEPGERVTGWVAASETFLSKPSPALVGYQWLNALTPVAQVGKTIKLFYIPSVSASDPRANGPRLRPTIHHP